MSEIKNGGLDKSIWNSWRRRG